MAVKALDFAVKLKVKKTSTAIIRAILPKINIEKKYKPKAAINKTKASSFIFIDEALFIGKGLGDVVVVNSRVPFAEDRSNWLVVVFVLSMAERYRFWGFGSSYSVDISGFHWYFLGVI